MEKLVIGLWGCYYGGSLLVLCGAFFAYSRSMHRIAINASLSALGPFLVVTAFLGGLPIEDRDVLFRLLAHLPVVVAALLVYQLLNLLRGFTTVLSRARTRNFFVVVCIVTLGVSWLLAPVDALLLCSALALVTALFGWAISIRNAMRGDRLGWAAVVVVGLVITSYCGLTYGVLRPDQWTWQVKAISAFAAVGYVVTLARVMWLRYAYLLELKKVMEFGPAYDPVTRLRSRAETDQMARTIFDSQSRLAEPLGVIVLTIANLYTLEKLHGLAAVNSALFLTAGRLRRALPARVEIGRLGYDGFLFIMRSCSDTGRLVVLAHDLAQRAQKSVNVKTSPDKDLLEKANMVWQAQVGVGVLHVKNTDTNSLDAIKTSRNMSRAAVSYASRIAWFDRSSGETVELPKNHLS